MLSVKETAMNSWAFCSLALCKQGLGLFGARQTLQTLHESIQQQANGDKIFHGTASPSSHLGDSWSLLPAPLSWGDFVSMQSPIISRWKTHVCEVHLHMPWSEEINSCIRFHWNTLIITFRSQGVFEKNQLDSSIPDEPGADTRQLCAV